MKDNREVKKEWRDENGFWSLDIECQSRWDECPDDEKERILKYLKLLKRFTRDPESVGMDNKKWLLMNCDVETEIVPNDILDKYRI